MSAARDCYQCGARATHRTCIALEDGSRESFVCPAHACEDCTPIVEVATGNAAPSASGTEVRAC